MEPSEGPLRNFLENQLYRRIGEPGTLSGSGPSTRFHLRVGGICEESSFHAFQISSRRALLR